MTATNHTITGVIVGLTLHAPAVALPLAFLLHFVLDALPHYGNDSHTSTKFKWFLLADMTLAALVLLFIVVAQPQYWLLAVACGVACASPDLMWLPRWLNELRGKPNKPLNLMARFHSRIQRYEHKSNYPYEIAWLMAVCLLLVKVI